jgi:serine-type D-Ala-D-Ala carboxypeptidase (penicillin-binding protein 5/6)
VPVNAEHPGPPETPGESARPGAVPSLDGAGPEQAVPDPAVVPPTGIPPLTAPGAVPVAEPVTSGTGDAGPTAAVAERPQRAKRRRNRRRIIVTLAVVVVVLLASGSLVVARRINRPLAQPAIPSGRSYSFTVPGTSPNQPWPATGQAAVEIPSLGYARQSALEGPVPIASLAKMATAVVILRDHPVAAGATGPSITVTADEANQFDVDLENDETNIPLQAGETLTEQQLLEALMVGSANDAAYTLAVWDAGSAPAFVTKMNAVASSLKANQTHYTDPSGFDPGSVSTAADSLRIAAAGMALPAFAAVVAMPSVTLPLAGVVQNIVKLIGTDGIVGVKSGYTSQAAGCMVLASYRTVDGRSVLVLAAALAQLEPSPPAPTPPTTAPATTAAASPPSSTTTSTAAAPPAIPTTTVPYSPIEAEYPLLYTGPIVVHLLDASASAIVPIPVVTRGRVVQTASADWGGVHHEMPVVATRSAWLLGLPGQRVAVTTAPAPRDSSPSVAGSARFTLGRQSETVPLALLHRVAEPTWWWRALHN